MPGRLFQRPDGDQDEERQDEDQSIGGNQPGKGNGRIGAFPSALDLDKLLDELSGMHSGDDEDEQSGRSQRGSGTSARVGGYPRQAGRNTNTPSPSRFRKRSRAVDGISNQVRLFGSE